ncbi:circularly permuted type 2 ATP-grasp protein [Portibacter marinus]|uniref:circularly permuted type 2 ATP-grasp protein n=1 Tax=Portibacter marinus TaxID=2898660 RepID=UPI001F2AF388|nr:circularly permuted type 2 ATP-grasp protein [Portibacter marinus]
MSNILDQYHVPDDIYDEVVKGMESEDSYYHPLIKRLSQLPLDQFKILNESAKLSFLNQGVTYALYKKEKSEEQIFPFDLFPRIINHEEWDMLEKGVIQRNTALNMFIHDVYNGGQVFKDNVIPERLIKSSSHYCKAMEGFSPPKNIYCHISGTDLIRHSDGNYYILEDNLRSPSGVSYVLINRIAMTRVIPNMFNDTPVEAVSDYTEELLKCLWGVANKPMGEIFCALLTPGAYNSAYFEHTYLAQKMGIELVEGRDLYVENDKVYLKSIGEKIQVDVLYRRIDDGFLDPEVFKPDSMLGVPGLMRAYLKGNITIINAPGTGISDDKAVCAYVPDLIKYYLDEDPILMNVPTYICEKPEDLQYVLDHMEELVVKPVDLSGGYGVCICDQMSKGEIAELKEKVKANPREFIAQPKMLLSTHSTYIEESEAFEPRHIDLRTFTLMGSDQPFVLKGGLTRTALTKGSLIVNSSQGGGSKDTWVIKA